MNSMRHFFSACFIALQCIACAAFAVGDDPGQSEEKSDIASATTPEFPPGRVVFEQSETERRIRETLDTPTRFEFDRTPLGDVAAYLREKHRIPIDLDLPNLVADGKGPETLITKSVGEGSLRSALGIILDPERLTFVVHKDHLVITTKTAASIITPVRIYQVHDLVLAAGDLTAAEPDFMGLIDLLTSTIQPDTWRDAGGTQGSVSAYRAPGVLALVVTQTDDVHEEIERLFANLRSAKQTEVRNAQLKQRRAGGVEGRSGQPFLPFANFNHISPPQDAAELIEGVNELACDLYPQVAQQRVGENIVFAPLGVTTAVATAYVGASGRTAEEMGDALHLPSHDKIGAPMRGLNAWLNGNRESRAYSLQMRTRMFVQPNQRLLASYLGTLRRDFGTFPVPIDLQTGAEAAVASAVGEDTDDFLDPSGLTDYITPETRLMVLNTVAFRGRWANPFSESLTRRDVFQSADGELQVAMMNAVSRLAYGEFDEAQVVRKDYDSLPGFGKTAMYFIVPPAERGSLERLESRVTPENLKRWTTELDSKLVEFHVPKFTFDNFLDLKPFLKSLCMKLAFSEEADFSGIDGDVDASDGRLLIEQVLQKAKIEVNERETRAAAATVMQMQVGLGGGIEQPELPVLVRCDRPFLFFIRDEATGVILFLGRVSKPNNDPHSELTSPK